jgi:hypothetical protein
MGRKTKRALTGEWRRRFLTIAPAFARMVFCASCRDPAGRYSEPWLVKNVTAEECDQIVRKCHLNCFKQWMSLSLTERLDDLEAYLVTCPTDVLSNGEDTVAACLEFCRALVPPDAKQRDVVYFSGQVDTVLQLLRERRRESGS